MGGHRPKLRSMNNFISSNMKCKKYTFEVKDKDLF
jgi:hypothetical protein